MSTQSIREIDMTRHTQQSVERE